MTQTVSPPRTTSVGRLVFPLLERKTWVKWRHKLGTNLPHGTSWRTRWPRTAKPENGRTRQGTQCKKKRAQDWTKVHNCSYFGERCNCHYIEQLENTGSKAISIRTRDLRWLVTDSSKNSSVPIRKLSKRTSSPIVQKFYREREASPPASAVLSSVSPESTLTIVTQSSPAKKDTRDKPSKLKMLH